MILHITAGLPTTNELKRRIKWYWPNRSLHSHEVWRAFALTLRGRLHFKIVKWMRTFCRSLFFWRICLWEVCTMSTVTGAVTSRSHYYWEKVKCVNILRLLKVSYLKGRLLQQLEIESSCWISDQSQIPGIFLTWYQFFIRKMQLG